MLGAVGDTVTTGNVARQAGDGEPQGLSFKAIAALGIVWIVWGSTYMAMRVAVQALPPFELAAARFYVAPAILFAISALRREPWAPWREVRGSAIVGLFLLFAGNGMVVWSVQYIPSGLSALLVASLPLWTLGLESLLGGARPTLTGLAGILLGFVGVVTLMWPGLGAGWNQALWAEVLVLGGTVAWAVGTLIGRRIPVPASSLQNSAWQMLAAAVGFTILTAALREPLVSPSTVPWWAWGAIAYLVVFGSCVAFSAYAWLVQNVRPDLVATYAYVNPVVAVGLGAVFLHEPVTAWTLAGAALIVGSVALVIRGASPAGRRGGTL
ncbi:MAG: EamA family transporter [Cyanobacteria bacterium RYN_339]|nr:EamA family transporter [Cyanobacteria bacterium RYN_339]